MLKVMPGDTSPAISIRGKVAGLMRPGSTCWRIERAGRTSLIIDAAEYFRAAKEAMLRARHSILLVGWDFDPHIRFHPDNMRTPRPDRLDKFLESILAARDSLHVYILIYNLAPSPYWYPNRGWWILKRKFGRGRLHVRLDCNHPWGSSRHSKLLVVDDSLAFCGGVDLAENRWDVSGHSFETPERRLPDGEVYDPWHDVMLAVDGNAAKALGDLIRDQWRAAGVEIKPPPVETDLWPRSARPDLEDVCVGIGRTRPRWKGSPEIREIEALYVNAIASARKWIYIENQYLASAAVARALAARLGERDGPDIVAITHMHTLHLFDRPVTGPPQDVWIKRLSAADRWKRLRIYAPLTASKKPIYVHSKMMIVDDRLLHAGSANLNNRSMGFDSECDLSIDAYSNDDNSKIVRGVIRKLLIRLIACHLGRKFEEVDSMLARSGGLIQCIDALESGDGGRLLPVRAPRPSWIREMMGERQFFDPRGRDDNWRPWRRPRLLRS